MKKILVISDNHGKTDVMYGLVRVVKPLDLIIHCGDIGIHNLYSELSKRADCPVYAVSGNNDYGMEYPGIETFSLSGHKALLTHGHRQRVYYDLTPLCYLAEENGADMVFFGHLHIPLVEKQEGITLINPGSLTYHRQSNRMPSYVMLTITDEGEFRYAIRYVTPELLDLRS